MGIRIVSTGRCLPELVVTNDDLTKFLDTSDEWIRTRTGIRQRNIATHETTSELAGKAAKIALERSGLPPEKIGLVICATLTSDVRVPMAASNVKKALGIDAAAAYDMNANCSSFLYAVASARGLMETCGIDHAIVVGADLNSQYMNWGDRSTCVLFGDGAGAVVLSRAAESRGILSAFISGAIDVENCLLCRYPRCATPFSDMADSPDEPQIKLNMKGKNVMRFAVNAIAEAVTAVTEKADVSVNDVKLFVPHQANSRILQSAARRLDIDEKKFFINIDHTANTSSATIPIALDEAVEKELVKKGDLIMLLSFGGGLSSGAVLLEW